MTSVNNNSIGKASAINQAGLVANVSTPEGVKALEAIDGKLAAVPNSSVGAATAHDVLDYSKL